MKTIHTNNVAVTIAKGLLGVFAVAMLMLAALPTLSIVHADESGEEFVDGSVGGDTGNFGFYSQFEDTTAFFVGDSSVGGDVTFADTIDIIDSSVGGDTLQTSSEIAYVVYEETSYPYYYDYGGHSGFSAGYSYTYPSYNERYNGNYNYNYNNYTYTDTYRAPEPGPTCTLTANRTSIDEGDTVRLTWTTANVTDVSINNGVGTVSRSGSDTVSPSTSRTYALVANGPGGSVWCSETIIVDEDDNNDDNDNVRCDSFTASDTSVDEGDRVTLRWRTTNADDVRINQGVGDVDDDGSESVTVDEDTTFTLTARDGNDTDTCRVTVRVDGDNDSNDRNAPRCTFHISDTTISNGGSTILSWSNDRTDRMVIKDENGKIIADSRNDRDIDEDTDAYTVRPRESTTYTMSVYNGNVRRTCELGVTVGSPIVGGITLSSVPYTGFDAGPVLTTIFYTVLVVWGLILAYVLVIRKRDEVKEVAVEDWSLADPIESDEIHIENEIPTNLPVGSVREEDSLRIQELESYAHTQYALVSSDALRFIAGQSGTPEEERETLDRVIALAKTKYPKEGEWVVINKERVLAVLS
jgi:hypothetical protein